MRIFKFQFKWLKKSFPGPRPTPPTPPLTATRARGGPWGTVVSTLEDLVRGSRTPQRRGVL